MWIKMLIWITTIKYLANLLAESWLYNICTKFDQNSDKLLNVYRVEDPDACHDLIRIAEHEIDPRHGLNLDPASYHHRIKIRPRFNRICNAKWSGSASQLLLSWFVKDCRMTQCLPPIPHLFGHKSWQIFPFDNI